MRKVTLYPAGVRESVLAKALPPNSTSIVELVREFQIPYSTIRSWLTNVMNKQNTKQVNVPQRPKDKSAEDKLQAVIDTAGKTNEERGAYCRSNGMYINHLDEWKNQILEALSIISSKKYKADYLQATNEVKQLKRDLHRKDTALAEVSALLILKKKADLLWGDNEDV